MEERLQKILSSAGVCSRRTAETYITAGRVTVNGQVASLGDKANPEQDDIALDGQSLKPVEELVYVMLHKPRGYVSTLSDEQGRKTVAQLVQDCGQRVWPVGRLDLDSEGLLLLSNDGDLTHKLLHPSHQVEKEYLVKVTGDVLQALPILQGTMELDGQILAPAKVIAKGSDLLSITIHQGKNRQVRRMCAQAGLVVERLRRVREGNLHLGDLKVGTWRRLTQDEIDQLKSLSK